MTNLIKAEIYKHIHRPYFYIITLVVSCIILWCEVSFSANMISKVYVISVVCPIGIHLVLMLIILFSVVFSEEYKFNSLKNLVASNVSKEKIYLGKLLAQIFIIIIVGAIVFGVFLGGLLLLEGGDGYTNDMLINFCLKIAAMIPILLSGIALCNVFMIGIRNEGIAIAIYIAFLLIGSYVVQFLSRTIWDKLIVVNDYLFQNQTSIMSNLHATNNEIIHAALVGIISFAIFTIIGGLLFKRVEAK